ncbi:FxSxx-COOH system tetratricopeptide repeat protein [Streptomyces sp. G1]|uniref:FxSxx-COOH system tetratricopeptide repeat protein n=1 Tax=Streptomyces sp. G1 TaxID=361572 RepID=UPI00202DDFB1|nr:FxSxx-COOH system tetratricopeptide repeat protein [Streptomyces sp. G1]MCM1967421.1 FxSxx-COOH system tetratricopeptide repeat protein [Streptomyces sp. G1]
MPPAGGVLVHAVQGSLAAHHIGQVTYQAAPRHTVSWPHQVGVIPRRAGSFQDRAEVHRLRAAVNGGGTAVVCQVLAGMGGVGKTQLAADHARRAWADGQVDLLVWVTAATRQAVIDAYARAAADILHTDPADPERAAQAFLAWLEPAPGRPRWLIVLDDVADPADLRDLWPPAHPGGRTLVTTRRRDAALATHGRLVPVGLFTPAEATAHLRHALTAQGRSEPEADLAALAEDLGHLPLALSQAAAYLVDTGLSAAAYRTRLADRARQLADLLPEPGELPDDQSAPAAAAWSLSVDRANELRPAGLARPMLQLAAMLDPNGIPEQVLTGHLVLLCIAAQQPLRDDGSPAEEPPKVTEEEATGALRALHRLSLVDHSPSETHQAVRVHQIVQRAVREPLDPDHRDLLARIAAQALMDAWPGTERDTGLASALRANTTALMACAGSALYQPVVHPVLYHLGESLGHSGQVAAAIQHLQQLTDTATHLLGPDDPGTLTSRSNLALWRGRAGDTAGAAEAAVLLLEVQLRVYGPDHPNTLVTRSNLATLQGRAGDASGAAAAFDALLEDQLRVLGPDHPNTLTGRNNHALWLGHAGDAAGAAAALAPLVEDYLRVLGPDHPSTLATRNNLAGWRGNSGDPAGAAAALATLLEDQVRVLGPDHPSTLMTRHNLAHLRGKIGDPAGAADETAALLHDRLRVLGPDHPDTLATRSSLVHFRAEAENPTSAAAAFALLLEDRLRVLGPDHPDTLATRFDLSVWHGLAGDPGRAAKETAAVLEDHIRVLGPDHPGTATVRVALAHWRRLAGEP